MGLRILYDASQDMAALYCSTTDVAFGPVFYRGGDYTPADDRALAFIKWLPIDAREYSASELEARYGDWLAAGEPNPDDPDDDPDCYREASAELERESRG